MTTDSTRIPPKARNWAAIAAVASFALFLSALQWHVNGSPSPYTTDVGEIQNALPRWGTIHFTGYPQYTFLGSLFVTLLRTVGIEPAAGASLFSALWGALTVGWFTLLLIELGVWEMGAALLAFLFAMTGSMWIDASIAEIHTMTMFLTVGSFYLALRYGRDGSRRELLWLVVVFTQGIVHQRAMAFLAPTLLILVWPRLGDMLKSWKAIIGLALLAPLTYLYLPIREWMGADWTFNAPGTWQGFWSMIMDTKADRIISAPSSLGEMWERLRLLASLVHQDLAAPVTGVGVLGLTIPLPRGRDRAREGLAWIVGIAIHGLLCLMIWEGQVSDALLAAKLPLILLAIVGLGYTLTWCNHRALTRVGAMVLVAMMAFYTHAYQRPTVVAITRDPTSESVIASAESIPRDAERETVVLTPWGHDYWALRYAQSYRGELRDLALVDHNAPLTELSAEGYRMITPRKTFYTLPMSWWQTRLGSIHLDMPAPGFVEITPADAAPLNQPTEALLALENGLNIASATQSQTESCEIIVEVVWQARRPIEKDWSVAVHLLAQDPPAGPEHILAQADQSHPVAGLYPVTQWRQGETVRDQYTLTIPETGEPVAIRIGMYRQDADGQFVNTSWLTLPIP